MKRGALVSGLATVALLSGGAVTVFVVRAQATEQAIAALLESASIELQREAPDRTAISPLLRRIAAHEASDDPRLLQVRAELQFAIGHLQDAWVALEPLALGSAPTPQALLLAARVHVRLHALRGDLPDVDRAMSFAAQHYDASRDVASLFLAWQCARRGDRAARCAEYAELLQQNHADSVLARVADALEDPSTTLAVFRAFERELDVVPVEVEAVIAAHLLADEKGGVNQVDEAIGRIKAVLQAFPSSVDARNLAALGYHRGQDRGQRDAHLDWLLENAPPNDRRRATWTALRQAPVQGG